MITSHCTADFFFFSLKDEQVCRQESKRMFVGGRRAGSGWGKVTAADGQLGQYVCG